MKNNKNKKLKKFKNGQQPSNNVSLAKSLLGLPARKIVKFSELIQSSSGNNTPVWTTSTTKDLNIYSRFFGAADYSDMASDYQRCKIHSIKVTVTRVQDEANFRTIYPDGIPTLFIGYFPAVGSGVVTNQEIIDLESSISIAPFRVNSISHVYQVPNMQALDSTSAIVLNMSQPFDVNSISGFTPRGVMSIGWKTIGNASSSSKIFDVQFEFMCTFDIPF